MSQKILEKLEGRQRDTQTKKAHQQKGLCWLYNVISNSEIEADNEDFFDSDTQVFEVEKQEKNVGKKVTEKGKKKTQSTTGSEIKCKWCLWSQANKQEVQKQDDIILS